MLTLEAAYDLFWDERWYLHQYPQVKLHLERGPWASASDYFKHAGYRLGHSPGPRFSVPYYTETGKTYDPSDRNDPVRHYVSDGMARKVSPHWLFSESFYREHNLDVVSAIEKGQFGSGFHHFRHSANTETRRPHPLFCSVFLEEHLPEGASDVWDRYLSTVPLTGMAPGPLFDPVWYLARNEECRGAIGPGQAFASPVEHFLRQGLREERSGLPDFDVDFYLQQRPDVADAVAQGAIPSAMYHWLFHGIGQNLDPNRYFNSLYYIENNAHVAQEIRDHQLLGPFEHFLLWGKARGLQSNRPIASMHVSEDAAKIIFSRRARVAAHQVVANAPIALPTPRPQPVLSIVIPVHNHFEFTAQLLLQISDVADDSVEVIVVDDQSTDRTIDLTALVDNLTVVRTERQLGFPGACNAGLRRARGTYVSFLNNDIELGHGALRRSVATLEADPSIGAVGGRIIRTHGKLQEAGSIVWKDGSCLGYGRDEDPTLPQFQNVCDVDYASACMLTVRRDLLEQLDGFDEAYAPGYYEEADLCMRIRNRGLRVVMDPRIYLYHFEYASFAKGRPPAASHRIMAEHQAIFRERHGAHLATHPTARVDGAGSVVDRSRRGLPRVLMIEDLLPVAGYGSGFVRSHAIIKDLLRLGCHVTLVALFRKPTDDEQIASRWLPGVEVLYKDDLVGGLAGLLARRRDAIDAIWVCRTLNAQRLSKELRAVRQWTMPPRMILDTEALASTRQHALAEVLGDSQWSQQLLESALRSELSPGDWFDAVITVNEHERSIAQSYLPHPQHHVLGHGLRPIADRPDFGKRSGFLFVGAVHSEESPNFDSLAWFLGEVWPLIREALPGATCTVAGYWLDSVPVPADFAAPGVSLLGAVDDLTDCYAAHRVFVAPTRFAAGIPYKVHEAASHGLPSVVTELLSTQLGWASGSCLLSAPSNDAVAFARACSSLHEDESQWRAMADATATALREDCSPEAFTNAVRSILGPLQRSPTLVGQYEAGTTE